jgi:glycosyltransferase involved in cell wall biosynthesis
MKTIALMAVKNEDYILPYTLGNISLIVDEIIIVDDDSSDNSREIAQKYNAIILPIRKKTFYGSTSYSERNVREQLLDEGRKRGGTHFVCLDADECFTMPFIKSAQTWLSLLKPGQKLALPWITLWKSCTQYKNDKKPWKGLIKDFIFCDDGISNYTELNEIFIGRTPIATNKDNTIAIPSRNGAVLHFQFAFWEKTQLKQAWYRCLELIKHPSKAYFINMKYQNSLDDTTSKTTPIHHDWVGSMALPEEQDCKISSWHLAEILRMFKNHEIITFEPLQIWHIPELYHEFINQIGRQPKPILKSPVYTRLKTQICRFIPSTIKNVIKKTIK